MSIVSLFLSQVEARKVPWDAEKEMQLLSFTPGSTRLKSMPCLPAFQLYKKDTLPILYVCLLVPPRPSKEVWVMHTNENSTKKNSKVAVKAVKELIFLRSTPLECLITVLVFLPISKRQNQNELFNLMTGTMFENDSKCRI